MANIEISDELYEKLEKMASKSEFESVSEYVEFILNELTEDEEEMTPEEEEQVKERLKELGYM